MTVQAVDAPVTAARPSLRGHLEIARLDHWVKNVFVLPGVAAGLALDPTSSRPGLGWRVAVALLATGLVASSNYTLNEVLDAPYDINHPTKSGRAVPAGRVSVPLAYAQWLLLALLGLGIGAALSLRFAGAMLGLWAMGCVYNVRPVRSKDVPYLDVLTEAVNNPLRLLAGWLAVAAVAIPPATLLLSYWMVGCYFMATKRFAEVRHLADPARIAAYRRSLARVSEGHLLVVIMFYASAAMLFFGAFLMRYRIEMIAACPLVALVMAAYLSVGLEGDGAAEHPEKLYRERFLMLAVGVCALALIVLFLVDIPILHRLFAPDIPSAVQ